MATKTIKGKWAGYAETLNPDKSGILIIGEPKTQKLKQEVADRLYKYNVLKPAGIIWPGENVISPPTWNKEKWNQIQVRQKSLFDSILANPPPVRPGQWDTVGKLREEYKKSLPKK